MFYFKSHSINKDHHSLVPFTEPVRPAVTGQGRDAVGKLMCHDTCIFRATVHNIDCGKMAALESRLNTLITYINEYIENGIEDGIISGVIDVEDWKEDVFA